MFTFILEHTPLFYFIQSFWRDESFSALFAQHSLGWIIQNSSFDPPLYYILLHFWIKIFGEGEIAVRALSFFGFMLATYCVAHIARLLFTKKWLHWFVPILFFFNPMLLYYAFEARAYGWYIFFTVFTLYGYLKKDWKIFTIGSVLGFYTHLYSLAVPALCVLHYMAFEWKTLWNKKMIRKNPIVLSVFFMTLAILPWLIRVILVAQKFSYSWYYPVDFHLIKSVLGNMYLGYDGTPWFLWSATRWVSLAFFLLSLCALVPKSNRRYASLFVTLVYLPLLAIIGISFIKPLFVNRYLIFVTVGEVFVIGYAIASFKSAAVRALMAGTILISTIWFTCWYTDQHDKMDMRTPMREINTMVTDHDVIYADDPIIFLETLYYAHDRSRVYFYNPSGSVFPWFIGDAVLKQEQIVKEYPVYPSRTFVVHKDGTYSVVYSLPLNNKK